VQAADIIQTAEQDGRLNGFVYLLEAAGMVEMLEGEDHDSSRRRASGMPGIAVSVQLPAEKHGQPWTEAHK
jgi:hypothetical protein